MYLAGHEKPDFRTICNFKEEIEKIRRIVEQGIAVDKEEDIRIRGATSFHPNSIRRRRFVIRI